jgi:predicted Zn-dependent protease with MMP-like domain
VRPSKPQSAFGQLRKVGLAALVALSLGLAVVVGGQGFSNVTAVRLVEQLVLAIAAIAVALTAAAFVAVRLAGWRDPESEEEFEQIVLRAEELGREGLAADPEESEFMELDPHNDADFEELVRDALDELPDPLRHALRHVPVVISDKGRQAGAYGLYQGGQGRINAFGPPTHDRIMIFRDTLRRDFGHDPDLLRERVVKTVRHELAHHVGFDELGVSRLDL